MPSCPCSKKVAPEGMDDIVRDRKCTDILWLVFFVMFWIGMVVIGIIGLQNGDPKKLVYGKDYNSKVCSGETKYVYYPRINEDLYGIVTTGDAGSLDKIPFYGVCLGACPMEGEWVCDGELKDSSEQVVKPSDAVLNTCVEKTFAKGGAFLYKDPGIALDTQCQLNLEHCWKTEMDTKSIFYRCFPLYEENVTTVEVCANPKGVPVDDPSCSKKIVTEVKETEAPSKKNPVFEQMNSAVGVFMRYFADLSKAQWVIVGCGIGGGVFFGFVWLVLLRYAAPLMVWLTVAMMLLLCLGLTLFAYSKAGVIGENDFANIVGTGSSVSAYASASEKSQEAWGYVAWFMTLVFVIVMVIIIVMRKKINIAIGIIQEASKAVSKMKTLLIFPMVTITSLSMLIIWWLTVTMYLMSADSFVFTKPGSSDPVNSTAVNATGFGNVTSSNQLTLSGDNTFNYLMIYHFFGLLWTNQFNQSFGIMCVSGAVATWYFAGPHDGDNIADEDEIQQKMGRVPLLDSVIRTISYHLGTISAGAFLIAFIQFLRAIMAYIEQKTKDLQKSNPLMKLLMKCVQCILYCFEKSVKYVSRLAFIQTAIKGNNFCSAAMAAMGFMFREAALVGIITMITDFMMTMGKAVIALATGLLSFVCLQYGLKGEDQVSNSALPVLITMLFGFGIGSACLEVYETTIDTILLCFCMDKEANEKRGEMKAGAHLQEFVANNKKADAKEGESRPAEETKSGGGKKKKGAQKKKKAASKQKKSKKEEDDEEAVFL